ncbi:MAG TPA: hypothetical protein PLF54_09800, partial [Deltaproteobacteria bacterium]|nr:hypothetical protein [Deltaproteobacteria bacterium]
MRKIFFILYFVLGLVFMVGCASMDSAYMKATREDSIKSYERFLKSYPKSPYAEAAKSRLEALKEEKAFPEAEAANSIAAYTAFYERFPDGKLGEEARKRASASDREAFMRTCGIGTPKAFQGFMESYPSSKYHSLASGRIDFSKIESSADLAAYMQFITKYPNNPFVGEASAYYPLLWLDRAGKKVGVVIDVGEFVSWKGVLNGMRTTKEKVRQSAFAALDREIGKYGISLTLLDRPEDAKDKDLRIILIVKYSEKSAIAESLAKALSDLMSGPTVQISTTMTIQDGRDGFEYYSKVGDLKAKVGRIAMMKALCGLRGNSALSPLIVALNDNDPEIQSKACESLKKITGQDLKEDRAKWCELWEKENP